MGVFLKDKYDGDFFQDWNKAIDQAGFEKVDAGVLISNVLAVKDETELNNVKKAAEITNRIFSKQLKDQIINIIDGEKVRFSSLWLLDQEQLSEFVWRLEKTTTESEAFEAVRAGGGGNQRSQARESKRQSTRGNLLPGHCAKWRQLQPQIQCHQVSNRALQ